MMIRTVVLALALLMSPLSGTDAVSFGKRQAVGSIPEKLATPRTPSQTQDTFYYNFLTEETTYIRPNCLGMLSKNYDRPYYMVDGQPTWEMPAEAAWRELRDQNDMPYFHNSVLDVTTRDRPKELAWERLSVDKFYLHNTVTKKSVWRGADDEPAYIGHLDAKTGKRYFVDPKTKEASWESPSVEGAWEKAQDPEGREYYYNRKTNERTWELPAESILAWQQQHVEVPIQEEF